MKLILTQEVTGLGAAGDVVEVKDGYGRNYLVPRGLGIRWTRGGEKTIESIKTARATRAVRDHDSAADLKTKLEAAPVNVAVRAGEGGRLFGAVTVSEIAGAIQLIQDIRGRGATILFVEHVMRAVLELSHRVVVLNEGEVIAAGSPREAMRDPQVIRVYLGSAHAA